MVCSCPPERALARFLMVIVDDDDDNNRQLQLVRFGLARNIPSSLRSRADDEIVVMTPPRCVQSSRLADTNDMAPSRQPTAGYLPRE
jgi:hypothetical protein